MSLLPPTPVKRRSIRFLEEWGTRGWRLKVYGISYAGERPNPALVARAKELAEATVPAPGQNVYGVGFVGAHEGRGADLVFVDWWADENELHHRVWHSAPHERGALVPASESSLAACVWDLRVIAFERDAWVEHVLRRPDGPDVAAYLGARLDEDA